MNGSDSSGTFRCPRQTCPSCFAANGNAAGSGSKPAMQHTVFPTSQFGGDPTHRVIAMLKLYLMLKEMLTYVEPDPMALLEAGVDRDRYLRWHHKFVNLARTFGLITGTAGLAVLIVAPFFSNDKLPTSIQAVFGIFLVCILWPAFAFLFGCIFGATFACLMAPRDFLLGPLGRKWMGFVGTRNIYVAKMVCVIVLAGMTFVIFGMTRGLLHGLQTAIAEKEKHTWTK